MRALFHGLLFSVMAMVCVGGSCSRDSGVHSSNQVGNTNTPGNQNVGTQTTGADQLNSNSQPANANDDSAASKSGSDDVKVTAADNADANDGEAMIIKVENDVKLKLKGKSDFSQFPGGMFHVGDLLRVAPSSAAFADCGARAVCKLGAGDFSKCCGSECANLIALGPSPSDGRITVVAIADLPADQRQKLQASETRIRALGADEITTQYLIANLYSAWKVKEATAEVDKFSEKLNDPAASQKLRMLYWPMVKRNGDLYDRMGNKGRAEQTYKKLTENSKADDPQAKAAAHVSLGEMYVQDGRKEEAIQSLQKGKKLYEVEGNRAKAENVRKSINQIQKNNTIKP